MSSAATIPMIAPDGSIGDVPQSQASAAQAKGFKAAQDMLAPDGTKGVIPSDQVQAAIGKGFKAVNADPLQAAAATVAKPVIDPNDPNSGISDNSYSLAGTAYGAVAPPDPQKPHPDFKMAYDKDWNLKTTYPEGQKALDPRFPELSTDDQGNTYHNGNKMEVMGTPLVPTIGAGVAAKAATSAATAVAKTGAEKLTEFMGSAAGKKIIDLAINHAASAAKWGAVIKIAKTLGIF